MFRRTIIASPTVCPSRGCNLAEYFGQLHDMRRMYDNNKRADVKVRIGVRYEMVYLLLSLLISALAILCFFRGI